MAPTRPVGALGAPSRAATLARVLAVLCLCGGGLGCGDAQRPNLLVVVVDTLRADHVGFLGYERDTTPALDAFARDAAVFLNHHSHSSRTGPSVASLFTGLYPGAHGVLNPLSGFDAKGRLAASHRTLAERLREAGYATHAVVSNLNVSARFGFDQGFGGYEFLPGALTGQDVNRRALHFLDGEAARRGPFFLYLHYMEPHSPYRFGPRFADLFTDPGYDGPLRGEHEELDAILAGRLEPAAADREQLVALYDQAIRTFDARFGELWEALVARGLAATTRVVLLSDHGEELFDHGAVLHGYTLYQEQLRVPLLIRVPGAPPRRIDALTRTVDLFPTLLEWAGVPAPDAIEAVSLAGLLRGEPREATQEVFARVQLRAVRTVQLRSLQHGRWKLVESLLPPRRLELYDLDSDPSESRDLARRHPERARGLHERMQALDTGPGRVERVRLLEAEREALRELGYLPAE